MQEDIPTASHSPKVEWRHMIDTVSQNRKKNYVFFEFNTLVKCRTLAWVQLQQLVQLVWPPQSSEEVRCFPLLLPTCVAFLPPRYCLRRVVRSPSRSEGEGRVSTSMVLETYPRCTSFFTNTNNNYLLTNGQKMKRNTWTSAKDWQKQPSNNCTAPPPPTHDDDRVSRHHLEAYL